MQCTKIYLFYKMYKKMHAAFNLFVINILQKTWVFSLKWIKGRFKKKIEIIVNIL